MRHDAVKALARTSFAAGLAWAALAGACSGQDESPPAAGPSPVSSPATQGTPSTTTAATTPAPTATPAPLGPPPPIMLAAAFPSLPDVERPVEMVELPGQERMLLALQEGLIVSFPKRADAAALTAVHDQRDRTSRGGNEEGLLGMALDPAFASNGFVYVYYSAKPGARRTVLSRLHAAGSGDDFRIESGSELVLLEVPQPFSNHKGGKVAFGPDGMLYLGLGDGGSAGDPMGNGQDLSRNLLASILRIDVRGATADRPYVIPADNPFARGENGARPETWAFGLRNPWRFSFDRETGALWAGDVGQDEWEEVDLVVKGGNYGWNIMEGPECFRPGGCARDGLRLPVVSYGNPGEGCSVTGGYVYRGAVVAGLAGMYVYGDFCSGKVWAFDARRAATGAEPRVFPLLEEGPQIVSFAEDASGDLYVLSFDGRIYAIRGASG